jgi:hypothetical protein
MSVAPKTGGELFIVDNSDEAWKGLKYLQDWTKIASAFDIATGYFEIVALLALDGQWQKLGEIRIVVGNEVSARTRQAILDALKEEIITHLDASIESEKEKNHFLMGVAAIVQALRAEKNECRAYAKKRFHAKAYITHPRVAVISSVALVGSGNCTVSGLTQNIELSIQVKAAGDVRQLQDWFELHCAEAEDITPDILKTVERHIRDYAVFHSPGYRSRYAEFLKIDFPRLPLTGNLELFRALARPGGELTALHLLESPKLDQPITEYLGGRSLEVQKTSWSKNTVWLDKDQTTGFKGVNEGVWNFHIGGYQVCEKWLKHRKGRTLSAEDRAHYQKIVLALFETIRLMKEIDGVIEKHAGWPLK